MRIREPIAFYTLTDLWTCFSNTSPTFLAVSQTMVGFPHLIPYLFLCCNHARSLVLQSTETISQLAVNATGLDG